MITHNFQPGDVVKHIEIPNAVGILIEDIYFHINNHFKVWNVFWIQHPDHNMLSDRLTVIGEKWLKPYRKYERSKKVVDKLGKK